MYHAKKEKPVTGGDTLYGGSLCLNHPEQALPQRRSRKSKGLEEEKMRSDCLMDARFLWGTMTMSCHSTAVMVG